MTKKTKIIYLESVRKNKESKFSKIHEEVKNNGYLKALLNQKIKKEMIQEKNYQHLYSSITKSDKEKSFYELYDEMLEIVDDAFIEHEKEIYNEL